VTVETPVRPQTITALAECLGVSVEYGDGDARVAALRDVSLTIGRSERVALWGRSGSGKTTLLHVLGGLVDPTGGAVTWKGEPLSSLDAAARARVRARGIAYVFQGAHLLPHFTAYENVAFAAAGVEDEPATARTEELLGLVGLASKLDSLPAELSGGEAQRVAIARALAQRPELLLCDEPTGHLDSDTGQRVLDLVDALQAEFGFTLVVATHDSEVAARSERVLSLKDGWLA
jgi:predicted ABC-type transport system involved in lysophospholipase L1 biosynthesis ATPase subunit